MEGLIGREISTVQLEDASAPGSLSLNTKELVGAVTIPSRSASDVVIGTAASDGRTFVAAAYLLDGGFVHQIAGDTIAAFNGYSVAKLEAIVRSAISDNTDQ